MKRLSVVFGIMVGSLMVAAASADETKEIPLDQIWGYNLPGTKDVSGIPLPEGIDLERFRSEREQSIDEIRRALMTKPSSQRALPGFMISRKADFYTMRAIASQLRSEARYGWMSRAHQPRRSFPSDAKLTLVFFSHPTSYYVRLRNVERQGNTVTVHYQFEPHMTPDVTVHFALIPLGSLPAGKYQVDFQRIPEDRKYLDAGFKLVQDASSIVCDPFSFTIFEPPVESPPAKDATLVPLDQIWANDMPGTRNVRAIESQKQPGQVWKLEQSPLYVQIFRSLHQFPKEGEKVGPAFVVEGTGKVALSNAHAIFTKQAAPESSFPPDTDLTLVFYSFIFGRYVWIESVEQAENLITVNYRFVSHMTAESTTHFALIPLGKLPNGKFRVEIKQLPPKSVHGQTVSLVSDPSRFVCDSFSFRVRK